MIYTHVLADMQSEGYQFLCIHIHRATLLLNNILYLDSCSAVFIIGRVYTHKSCNRHWDCMVRAEVVEEVASSTKVVFTISNSHQEIKLNNASNFI